MQCRMTCSYSTRKKLYSCSTMTDIQAASPNGQATMALFRTTADRARSLVSTSSFNLSTSSAVKLPPFNSLSPTQEERNQENNKGYLWLVNLSFSLLAVAQMSSSWLRRVRSRMQSFVIRVCLTSATQTTLSKIMSAYISEWRSSFTVLLGQSYRTSAVVRENL